VQLWSAATLMRRTQAHAGAVRALTAIGSTVHGNDTGGGGGGDGGGGGGGEERTRQRFRFYIEIDPDSLIGLKA